MSGLGIFDTMRLVTILICGVFVSGFAAAVFADSSTQPSGGGLTVAADGSGDFKTVQAAVDSIPEQGTARTIIHIKPGTYNGSNQGSRRKNRLLNSWGMMRPRRFLRLTTRTIQKARTGRIWERAKAPARLFMGMIFWLRILRSKTARVRWDRHWRSISTVIGSVFYNCRFLGWQDTVMTNRNRQYFQDCYIAGHVDFIFGAATVYFENCEIHCRDKGSITAASTPQASAYGYVFDHCKITSEAPAGQSFWAGRGGRMGRRFS